MREYIRVGLAILFIGAAVAVLSAGDRPEPRPARDRDQRAEIVRRRGPVSAPVPGTAVVDGPAHSGVMIRNQIAPELQHKNLAGIDGLGLCGFASLGHAARYQGIDSLKDVLQWMTSRDGGVWPEKMDRVISEKAGESAPSYFHAFGSPAIPLLEQACKSGRMPLVTYGYGERYGVAIDHMVNLVHLDRETDWAVVLDNNFVAEQDRNGSWNQTVYEWMPVDEFVERFEWGTRGKGQGWAIVIVDHPQPPSPIR